mmetsp:Transcript_8675/g.31979  ORF Transcript_8675/g.31979 Transcript_8675/m.31979 type:complete len:223 (-) Transcript_8675:2499-3167(-)
MNNRARVLRLDLYRCVHAACRSTTQKDRDFQASLLHLLRDGYHLIQRRCDQPTQANNICLMLNTGLDDIFTGLHDAAIDDLEVVASQDNRNNILSDIVYISLHGRDYENACVGLLFHTRTGSFGSEPLLFFHEGNKVSNSLLHHTRGFDNLRQEHLPCSEQVAYYIHTVHQRTFNDVQRLLIHATGSCLLCVSHTELIDSLHQRMFQALCNRKASPVGSARS